MAQCDNEEIATAFIRSYFREIDGTVFDGNKDSAKLVTFVAKYYLENASVRMAGNPVAIGHAAIAATVLAPFQALSKRIDHHSDENSVTHLSGQQFLVQGSVSITIGRATGDKVVTIGSAVVFELCNCPVSGMHVQSIRVYTDPSPILVACGLVIDSDADGNVAVHPK